MSSNVPDRQFRVRPDSDPDFFFKLGSGWTRIRIVFSIQNETGTGSGLFFKLGSGRTRIRIVFSI